MIEEYKFGSIVIDGKIYRHDVEVRWTGEVLEWWRNEGHKVIVQDIKRALLQNPETVVIGTGYSGEMQITQECLDFIKEKNINLIIDKTEEAVKTFNIILEESEEEEGESERVLGLFHLTC